MDKLAEIVATKRREVAERRVREPVSALRDLAAAQTRLAAENAKRKLLADGTLGLDLYNMRAALAAKGLTYV